MARAKLTLFTPGPVRIPPLVADYLADPPCNYHRQGGFGEMFRRTQSDLKELVGLRRPEETFATLLATTGTGANEACLSALSRAGSGVIVRNGFFGARLVDQARQSGLAHEVFDAPDDRPVDPAALDSFLSGRPQVRWVFFVAHETRAGLANPLVELGRLCRGRGLFVGADVVSAAYAYPLDLEAAGLDLAVTSSAKALMAVPGIGIVFTRLEAAERLAAMPAPGGYYLDLMAEFAKQRRDGQPRFAQPVALHAALHAACLHLKRVGIVNHFARIRRQMEDLEACLGRMGLRPLLPAAYRSGVVVNFDLPRGMEYPEFSNRMEAEGYYLLYGIPGDHSHFQVSTIGDLSDEDVAGLEQALGRVLGRRAGASRAERTGDVRHADGRQP
ncbi:MAG: alanine--glyoxylate aminotransferase family protein [Deltaproteobacteria bacterium]|nr:alanine--glyoxylate aminotransferase family protein [Deltaproteobacteria bacterium]